MIVLKSLLVIVGLLIKYSVGAPADIQNETPSKVTVNEYFNNPILPPPASPFGPPSLGSNFVHQGTNFFFNPQILLGTHVPPPGAVIAAEKSNASEAPPCNKVPQVPVLPEIIVTPVPPPKPVEVITEEPIAIPIPPPTFVPIEYPKLPDPVIIKEIPDAPVLPPLELPNFSVQIEETVEVIPPAPPGMIPEAIPVPFPIPEAPILPPLVLPEIPPIVLTVESKKEPCPPTQTAVIELLPLPELKPAQEEASKVTIHEESVFTFPEDIMIFNEIPAAPELPPLVMPDIPKPIPVGELKKVVLIPPTPENATFVSPKLPMEVIVETEKETVFPIPTECARNIVLERVLPNMVVSKKTITKSVEIISIPAAANYPVLTTPFVPKLVIKN